MNESKETVRLTAVQFDTLAWMVAFEKKRRRCPTQREVAERFGIHVGTACVRCQYLAAAGCLEVKSEGRNGYTKILPRGREVAAAGRAAATAVQLPTVERLRDLPEAVHLEAQTLAVLRVVHKGHLAKKETSTRDVAAIVGRPWGGVRASMDTLVKSGLLTAGAREGGVRRALTPLGLAVAEGRVRVEPPLRPGRSRVKREEAPRKPKGPGIARVRAAVERRAPPAAPPLPPPPRVPADVREAPTPAPAPETTAAPEPKGPLAGYRGIKHPALPTFSSARTASRSLVGWS